MLGSTNKILQMVDLAFLRLYTIGFGFPLPFCPSRRNQSLSLNFIITAYIVNYMILQLGDVVKELCNRNGKKWPLVILHNKRLRGLMENPSSQKLVEEWMDNGALYTTPNGSNDDW